MRYIITLLLVLPVVGCSNMDDVGVVRAVSAPTVTTMSSSVTSTYTPTDMGTATTGAISNAEGGEIDESSSNSFGDPPPADFVTYNVAGRQCWGSSTAALVTLSESTGRAIITDEAFATNCPEGQPGFAITSNGNVKLYNAI